MNDSAAPLVVTPQRYVVEARCPLGCVFRQFDISEREHVDAKKHQLREALRAHLITHTASELAEAALQTDAWLETYRMVSETPT